MTDSLADRLVEAVMPTRMHTAVVVRAVYQPVGGAGGKVMPPTYPVSATERDPNAKYLIDPRLVDGEQRRTVVIDQEPSQANRVEEALRDACDAGVLQLPMFEMRCNGIRLTSLDFPHRYADAYVRDSLVGGVRFDQSPVGKRLRATTARMCARCMSASRARCCSARGIPTARAGGRSSPGCMRRRCMAWTRWRGGVWAAGWTR